jgi:predicted kinase
MESSQVIADARRLEDNFTPLPAPATKPGAIIVSGLPGTGKTYFSRRLAERLPCVILESDALRKQLFPKPQYTPEESEYLFRTIYHLAEELLRKGATVILDATNLEEKHRERICNIAEKVHAKPVLVSVTAPPELVKQRLKVRAASTNNNSDADWAVYQKMQAMAEKISRRHFTADTSRDINPVIEKIIKEVSR